VPFVSTKLGQFRYFDQQLRRPDWSGKRVLDFGGNRGNLLIDSRGAIDPEKYWCIDVGPDALLQGKELFPNANWVYYDRHNFQFNPAGIRDLKIPTLGGEFDLILAYSVFTHTSKAEMIDMVGQLYKMLADRGVLTFTFLDPRWIAFDGDPFPGSNMKWRLQVNKDENREIDVDSMLDKSKDAKWVTLVEDELYLDDQEFQSGPTDEKTYIVLCDPEHMKAIFPSGEILSPAAPERQHCCVIKKNLNPAGSNHPD
jgi:hypothetical protein